MSGALRMLRSTVWRQGMGALLLFVVLAVLVTAGQAAETAQPTPSVPAQPAAQRLVGRWVRLDGGYVLEVQEAGKDGSLKAAYFNPRPISEAVPDRSATTK